VRACMAACVPQRRAHSSVCIHLCIHMCVCMYVWVGGWVRAVVAGEGYAWSLALVAVGLGFRVAGQAAMHVVLGTPLWLLH
jgi:hypothetical protein